MKLKRPYKAADDTKSAADEILSLMPAQGERQWGNAVKSFWFYDSDLCPGRMAPPVGAMKIKGGQGLPINAFIYRPRDVLIGYFLVENAPVLSTARQRKIPSNKLHCMPTSRKI
jgi:hypothetical protein